MLDINPIIPTKLNSIYSHKIKNPFIGQIKIFNFCIKFQY